MRCLSACGCACPRSEWLDPSDPMSLNKILFPVGVDGAKGSLLLYEITVFTSDIRGAGTDSNVSVELHGDKDKTGALRLDTSVNNFERGAKVGGSMLRRSFPCCSCSRSVLVWWVGGWP